MSASNTGIDFETILADERPRLVRLCAWFASNEDAAQDLAQETLIVAWKNRDQLESPDKLKPWTSAIARNICLNWSRQASREQAHSVAIDPDEDSFEDEFSDDTNLELELDRQELANLLDKALAMLPPETGQMLIEHYIQESSHAEIAEKMHLQPGAVAVRLQRGKLTLQKIFRKHLQAESQAFGLIQTSRAGWEETNIWCPCCGRARLLGKFQKNEVFALRCSQCDPDPQSIMAGLDLTKPYHARLLGNTKSYKPAYSRLLTSFAPLYRQALQSHGAACLACGHIVHVTIDEMRIKADRKGMKQIRLQCPACGWASNKALSGLVLSLPEAQRFWRQHPRIQTLPSQEIEVDGSPAFLVRLQSVQDAAEITIIARLDSFDPIAIHTNVSV
ncbi:MAG TPA: RNA polymerase sigma factor [Anaerolineales bacterium]|nr:RNA polymerase sigma factor [Anaerolineales bacterium]